MSLGTWATKDPQDVLDFKIDWSQLVGADTIVSSVWEVPEVFVASQESINGAVTVVWLSGGAVGTYKIKNTITTSAGRVYDRSVVLPVQSL